jgi:PAS domain S-box-containing protein
MIDAVHPDDLPRVIERFTQSLATGTPYESEQRHLRHDGVYRWHQVRALPFYDEDGRIIGWHELITDVDDRMRADEALRRSEVYLREAQRLSHTGSFGWQVESGELVWSAETFRILGYDPVVRPTLERVLERVHPDDRGLVEEAVERAGDDSGDIDFKHRLLLPDGTLKHVHVVAHGIKDRSGTMEFFGALMEITEQQRTKDYLERALADLRNSEAHFRAILNAMPTHVWSARTDGSTEFQNQQWLDFAGLTVEEAAGWGWRDALHLDDADRFDRRWSEIRASGAAGEVEARLRRHDGAYRWFLIRAVPIPNEEGEIVKWYGTNTDIEDLKRTSEALRSSEEFSRGQAQALSHILNALARESSQDRVIEHVLGTITAQLNAHSCSVWSKDVGTGLLNFEFALVMGEFRTKSDVRHAASFPCDRVGEIWPGVDIFNTGRPHLVEDIRAVPDFPWRAELLAQSIVSVLVVPMLVAGQVSGVVGIRFTSRRVLPPEDVQLAQTLANQAMLAMQLGRISAQSRETAVLAERNRMARDIHDTLAQGFTGVIVQLEAAADAASRGLRSAAAEHLARARDRARESLMDARRSVQALRPQALEQRDLCAALDEMSRKMTARTSLRTQLKVTGVPRPLPEDCEVNLLRICQECLTNALRHAQANLFAMHVVFAADEIRLELGDDGCGFDVAARSDGFGLIGIRERVEQLGGVLSINSKPGKGTTTLIVLKVGHRPGSSPA